MGVVTMYRTLLLLLTVVVFTVAVGCNMKGKDSSPAARTGDNTPSDPVARVVYDFLEAVRNGDTEQASAQLTPLALQRTREMDLNFSPPGSKTARFRVGAIEMIDTDKAVVESVWTDVDADGQPNDEKITWALKLSESRWRISGMAAELGPDQPPVVMDFENPGQLIAPQKGGASASDSTSPRQASQPSRDPFQPSLPR